MTIVRGFAPADPPTPVVLRPRPDASGARFVIEQETAAEQPEAVARPASTGGVSSLLALQTAELEPVADREARRRGRDILAALRRLQADLLFAADDPSALDRLAGLVEEVPVPRDHQLAGVLRAIALRAKIEIARHHRSDPFSEQ